MTLNVAMIALAAFIVIPNQTLTWVPIKQAVLQAVCASQDGLWYLPYGQFGDGAVRIILSVIEDARGLHMVSYTIKTNVACSTITI